jgi:hypothetical protein
MEMRNGASLKLFELNGYFFRIDGGEKFSVLDLCFSGRLTTNESRFPSSHGMTLHHDHFQFFLCVLSASSASFGCPTLGVHVEIRLCPCTRSNKLPSRDFPASSSRVAPSIDSPINLIIIVQHSRLLLLVTARLLPPLSMKFSSYRGFRSSLGGSSRKEGSVIEIIVRYLSECEGSNHVAFCTHSRSRLSTPYR